MTLDDKVVVVTGGAGLIGQAFVHEIAQRGGVAIMADIDLPRARERATDLSSTLKQGRIVPMGLDITDESSVDRLLAEVIAEHGHVDGVVNNAYPRNRAYGRRVEEVTYADFCENISTHVGGYFLVMQRFARHFAQVGAGSIVNMGSIYGVIAPRFDVYDGTPMTMPVEYAAVKAGIIHLTRYFAQYYKAQGVRVNSLSPGGVLDAQPERFLAAYRGYAGIKGMLSPSDVVGTMVFLLSDDSRHMTGQNLVVDDGFTL